jgi:two-component system, OmpR family, heavy metal sensor histidine kinase CusS
MEQHREAIATALQDVERLGQIVKSLLLLAQAESGQVTLEKHRTDLKATVSELAGQLRLSAGEKRIGLSVSGPESCYAEVDRGQIERMLHHLLMNAVEYTQEGGEVRVAVEAGEGEVRVTVADNGPGIPPEHLEHIFERFYRVRKGETGTAKGAGLGLAYVAWVVKAHEGRIEARSMPGEGTSFEVTLPSAHPLAPAALRPVEAER